MILREKRVMQFVNSCILMLGLMILLIAPSGDCNGVSGLPRADKIEELTLQYQDSLMMNEDSGEERFFPTLTFPSFNGRIIGWKVAATENSGGGPPQVIPHTLMTDGSYSRGETMDLTECITSIIPLDNGMRVLVHESGPPSPGIPFSAGDTLVLFMRPRDAADFVPFLYSGTLQSQVSPSAGGFYSYYRRVRTPRHNATRLEGLPFQDGLLPLMSLELCSLDGLVDGVQVCDDTTLERNASTECEGIVYTTPAAATSEATSAATNSTTTTTTGGTPFSSQLLVVAIAVPAVLFFLLVVTLLVLAVACSLFCRKKRHSTYTTDIALEAFQNGGSSSTAAVLSHSYKTASEYSDPTFVISTSTMNGASEHSGKLKEEPAGNYEEPKSLVSCSVGSSGFGDVRNHTYDTPLHSREPSADQTTYSNTLYPFPTSPPTVSNNNIRGRQYHTLERPLGTPPTQRRGPSPVSYSPPSGSPHPPRLRLRSNDNLTFRKVSSGSRGPNNNNSNIASNYANTPTTAAAATDRFFRLETGAYVPTMDQRNSMAIKNLFDDTSYATFNRENSSTQLSSQAQSAGTNSPLANNWNFFEESESYWKPAADSNRLFQQLSLQKYREIDRRQIEVKEHLGSGEFGTVCGGEWHTEQGDLDIAIKMLNGQSSERDCVRFLQEAAIIGQFKHPNIVRLHGVVTLEEPVMIILDLIRNGDLRKYLRAIRPQSGDEVPVDLPQRLLGFCSQIALGMEYLSRKDFVHRDLAARNILLTEDYVCKIADFGMSRDLDDDACYVSNGGKVPIKWTAPEALQYREFSTATDVWSFGVLMYEVWSLGKTPYKDQQPEQTIAVVQSGCRLAPPPGCPQAIYKIMINCWHSSSDLRPSFANLLQALSQPTSTLLYWSPDNSNLHALASKLGAPLEASTELYSELQKTYMYASADD